MSKLLPVVISIDSDHIDAIVMLVELCDGSYFRVSYTIVLYEIRMRLKTFS